MIALEDRQQRAQWIEEAHAAGARLEEACRLVGVTLRTLQRWKGGGGLEQGDQRPVAPHPTPAHALSSEERERILAVVNEPRFAELPPTRIVPMLADEGVYLGSEATFYRVLRDVGQLKPRGRAKAPRSQRPPTTHIATAPNQVWCWDITYLPRTVKGCYDFLYLILDLYSRKIVGWSVHEEDQADHAAELLRRTTLAEGVPERQQRRLVLHGDNGAPLKATSVLAMLQWLQIEPSYSRPRVSDDNAYAEAAFRTAKYRPEFPARGFDSPEAALQWAYAFVRWYNEEHRHSGIRYVTPSQRHAGEDEAILAARHALYQQSREAHPQRWSGETRNWSPIREVALNPERENVVQESAEINNKEEFE